MTHDTIKETVEEVLKEFSKARDNDFLLCMHTYLKLGFAHRIPLGIVIHYDNLDSAPAFETITRIRREIQNTENRLKASEEVIDKREAHRERLYDYYATKGVRANSSLNSWMMA